MIVYKVYRYFGGEYPNDIKITKEYADAEKLGMMAEHWEIEKIKVKKNK
tara:strand:- start:126 stop:272 length:147 start_codon:yes stop_codon:yes gene_type:complete